MNPLFTVHAGEYLVGSYIEEHHRQWNVWVPSKDTGIDLLVTDSKNRKTVSLQVKFSKDFIPTARRESSIKDHLMATGWWKHDEKKIQESKADFWVFVLPSFLEHRTSFIIVPPKELLRRLRDIHDQGGKKIQSYLCVTKSKRCWEHRGLAKDDLKKLAEDRFSHEQRNFTVFLNAWSEIEKKLE
jgi:predicted helicase